MAIKQRLTQGIGQALSDIFGGGKMYPRSKKEKVSRNEILPGYPRFETPDKRILWLGWRYYREGQFEKVQFSRKWMRNALIFQGYHELEWSEINVAWEALIRDSGDYAFPNNYFRSHVMYGAGLYVKNEPRFDFQPTNDDFESHAISQAAHNALDYIKETVHYDHLRVIESIYLRLFGNSFRYTYYSLDPRFGHVTSPVYARQKTVLDNGSFQCPNCGMQNEGNPLECPQCGLPLPPEAVSAPTIGEIPVKVDEVKYPRGEILCEVVNPLEMGTRNSAPNLWHAPYLYRARIVDKLALQGDFPDVDLGGGYGTEGLGGESSASAEDLSLVYQQSLADLPGDPTQYAAWYERATSYARCMFLQMWIRPSQYAHDKELADKFPDGMYAGVVGDKLLESRNEAVEDHWTHFAYNPVPGRFWADGDDDLIPKQLQLNETERLILRNEAYSSVPQLAIDSQRIDPNAIINDPAEIIQVKLSGRPVRDAIMQLPAQALPQETWMWRESLLKDMEFHSGVFGSAIGMHDPGVNTFGGQEQMAARAEQTLSPLLLMYKEANEKWAYQALKLASENWLDERVRAVMGINGNWEFQKMKGAMLSMDKIKIVARLIPVDPGQQQALAQAVTAQLLNPLDPRVQRKALELFQLPVELSQFSADAKVQWEEIEDMKQGQPVQPEAFVDNDVVHAEICRVWLNTDEGREQSPDIRQLVKQHMMMHMLNNAKAQAANAAQMAAGQEAQNAILGGGGQPGEPGQPGQGGPQQGQPGQQGGGQNPQRGKSQMHPQGGQRGGQVPRTPQQRQQRASRGQMAKPKRPQPPGGNQYRVGRGGQGR